MQNLEAYDDNKLANQIHYTVQKVSFGAGYRVEPVTNNKIAQDVVNVIGGIDYRAKRQVEPGFLPVFLGLAFDPDNLRSQSFALYDNTTDQVVAVSTTVIAPKGWLAEQKYFRKENGGVTVTNFAEINGANVPDYVVIPAWTKVVPELRLKFAIPGFRAFREIMSLLKQSAPQNTWIEAIAKGQFPVTQKAELKLLTDLGVGTHIPANNLPFDIDIVGRNSPDSSSSVKMADLLGLKKAKDVGSSTSLGPPFTKKIN